MQFLMVVQMGLIEVEMVLSYVDSISISKENPTGGNVD